MTTVLCYWFHIPETSYLYNGSVRIRKHFTRKYLNLYICPQKIVLQKETRFLWLSQNTYITVTWLYNMQLLPYFTLRLSKYYLFWTACVGSWFNHTPQPTALCHLQSIKRKPVFPLFPLTFPISNPCHKHSNLVHIGSLMLLHDL